MYCKKTYLIIIVFNTNWKKLEVADLQPQYIVSFPFVDPQLYIYPMPQSIEPSSKTKIVLVGNFWELFSGELSE
jgi:hypothetical protein